jgi:hypothetical protein
VVQVKKKSIRVGMKVRSIYDPDHVFTIDRSKKPGRVFHEKGSSLWYGSHELQSVSERPAKLSNTAKQTAISKRSQALQGMPPGTFPQSPTLYSRTCLECGIEFKTKKKKTKFCSGPHRSRYHKRMKQIPTLIVGQVEDLQWKRLRSEKPVDTVSVVE